MFIVNMNFACGSGKYCVGDEVPADLPNNDERLQRGLIREVKTVKPEEIKETKVAKNVNRKSKNKTKQAE